MKERQRHGDTERETTKRERDIQKQTTDPEEKNFQIDRHTNGQTDRQTATGRR